jgi:hypothetical protein
MCPSMYKILWYKHTLATLTLYELMNAESSLFGYEHITFIKLSYLRLTVALQRLCELNFV